MASHDVLVVGAGPNGLAAAITLARTGWSVLVLEAADEAGGGARSAALTLPGFVHDVCSAVHPLAVSSPVFRAFELERHGLEWIYPPAPLAHPLADRVVVMERSLEETARRLGDDGDAYRRLLHHLVARWDDVVEDLLAPLRIPRHPVAMARFAAHGLRSARGLARSAFRGTGARALFAGNAAHSLLPLDRSPSAAFGLVLAAAGHAAGWPLPRGGASAITGALVHCLEEAGGEVRTGRRVASLDELDAPVVLLDLTPRQILQVAGHRLPAGYARHLRRYRYGPAAFKIDWALDGPVPWADPACARAGTVHLGGTLDELVRAEAAPWDGRHAPSPFVLLAQPSLFDPSRAPAGRHTAWAYCHVPHGSTTDMTERIEGQVERFAPAFRDRILDRHVMAPADLEAHNPNLVGGHINGGIQDLRQLFFRPAPRLDPYRTPVPGVYICSSSTPPGGGVHGMCGYFAARSVLRRAGRPAAATGRAR